MVSGQQIPEACIKNFVIVLRLVVHIPALRGIGFEDLKSRIPKCLSSFYFVNIYFIFSTEIHLFEHFLNFSVHQFYFFSPISLKALMKVHEHKQRGFFPIYLR